MPIDTFINIKYKQNPSYQKKMRQNLIFTNFLKIWSLTFVNLIMVTLNLLKYAYLNSLVHTENIHM